MLTKITYMYRDASNYKFIGEFIVAGQLDFDRLIQHLYDQEYFVPETVGLPHLLNKPMNQDDHYLHTITDICPCALGDPICSADELVSRFEKANNDGWF